MMARTSLLLLGLLCAGCDAVSQSADEFARDQAKSAVTQTLETRFPGVPARMVTPFTDCVIDAASAREIALLAQDALAGVDADTAQLITEIAARPEATQCIAQAGLSTALSL